MNEWAWSCSIFLTEINQWTKWLVGQYSKCSKGPKLLHLHQPAYVFVSNSVCDSLAGDRIVTSQQIELLVEEAGPFFFGIADKCSP